MQVQDVSYFPPVFGTAGRKKGAEILDRAYNFISPAMREIEVEPGTMFSRLISGFSETERIGKQ